MKLRRVLLNHPPDALCVFETLLFSSGGEVELEEEAARGEGDGSVVWETVRGIGALLGGGVAKSPPEELIGLVASGGAEGRGDDAGGGGI